MQTIPNNNTQPNINNIYQNNTFLTPIIDKEVVTENQLIDERAAYIKRLWEPYETESFNLKALIGDSPSSEEIVVRGIGIRYTIRK